MLNFSWDSIFTDAELKKMQIDAVSEFMKCETEASVEACVEFAKYLNFKKFDSFSYPIFLELFKVANHHTILSLVEGTDPVNLFSAVQSNYYIIDFSFKMLYQYSPGGVHQTVLEVIFGILNRNYHSAKEGFKLYPLSLENVNALGKFLDKEKKQSDIINRFILDILSDISDYTSINKESEVVDKVSAHAVAIRNAFFDRRVKMDSVLPPEILVRKDFNETTISPRETKPLA